MRKQRHSGRSRAGASTGYVFKPISFSRLVSHQGATRAPHHHLVPPILITHTAYPLCLSRCLLTFDIGFWFRTPTGVDINSVYVFLRDVKLSCHVVYQYGEPLLFQSSTARLSLTRPKTRPSLSTMDQFSELFLEYHRRSQWDGLDGQISRTRAKSKCAAPSLSHAAYGHPFFG